MKAPCLTDLLNHTFPLDHCSKGTVCQLCACALRIIHFRASCTINSSVFFPKHVKSFEPAWLQEIWLNLLDLWEVILHIEGLDLILKSCWKVFPSWKVFSLSLAGASIFILENCDDSKGDCEREQVTLNLIFCFRVGTLFSFTEKSL